MVIDMTIQLRVTDMEKGRRWYETFLKQRPDFIPHDGFVEWEIVPGCWLQVAEGTPAVQSGPLRLGVTNIIEERERLINELHIESFEIFSREEVPVKWGTFSDPWGNLLGLYEYLDKEVEKEQIMRLLGSMRE